MSAIEDPLRPLEHGLDVMRAGVAREFESLEQFALHIVAMEVAWKLQRREALKEIAKVLKKDAREQIGEYQRAVGPYPEWADLAESTEDEKARLGAPPDAPLERFRDLQKSFASELVGDEEVIVGSTDPNMEWHEFGTSKMPPRPVLGPALFKNLDLVQALIGRGAMDAILVGQRMGYRVSGGEEGPGE